jgi:hypothetical protein
MWFKSTSAAANEGKFRFYNTLSSATALVAECAAGVWTLGNASAKGSHTVNGYLSVNGAGTSGTASGEHPYLAVMKITGSFPPGLSTAVITNPIGTSAGSGNRIKKVDIKVDHGGSWNSIWTHYGASSVYVVWNDGVISFGNGVGYGIPYEMLITYEP